MESHIKIKYSPTQLAHVQDTHKDLSELLGSLLRADSIAILFCATKYGGKTTFLTIMLEEYFKGGEVDDEKLPSEKIEQNILRVNQWSADQGILFYRDNLKTFCRTSSCIKNKKKVIVVDDIDCLSESRQQMFRNCIDKYKHSIHFIFTCTNVSRVLSSIQSRLLILKITPLTLDQTRILFQNMLLKEKLHAIDDNMSGYLTKLASGNMKRLMTYLEVLKLYQPRIEEMSKPFIMDLCSTIPFSQLSIFLKACIRDRDIERGLGELRKMPFSLLDILDNILSYVKREEFESLCILTEVEKHYVINVIGKYVALLHTLHEDDELEGLLFVHDLTLIQI